jgi:hypothetical protein
MSRPAFLPSDDQRRMVKSMAAYGIRQEEIAATISVSAKTLRRRFRQELDRGATEANTQVGQAMYQMATSGKSPQCTMFWLRNRAGWGQNAWANRSMTEVPPFIVRAPGTGREDTSRVDAKPDRESSR